MTSAVKIDHRAIVAISLGVVRSRAKSLGPKTQVRVEVMRRSTGQHAALLRALSDADLSGLTVITEPQAAWDKFYAKCHRCLREFYPKRKITVTSTDPPHFTPGFRFLLRRKNRLMRAGHLDEASACARRIGVEIERRTKRHRPTCQWLRSHATWVLGQNGSEQNGTDKMVWTKWYTDKMVFDKMVRTKWYG